MKRAILALGVVGHLVFQGGGHVAPLVGPNF